MVRRNQCGNQPRKMQLSIEIFQLCKSFCGRYLEGIMDLTDKYTEEKLEKARDTLRELLEND